MYLGSPTSDSLTLKSIDESSVSCIPQFSLENVRSKDKSEAENDADTPTVTVQLRKKNTEEKGEAALMNLGTFYFFYNTTTFLMPPLPHIFPLSCMIMYLLNNITFSYLFNPFQLFHL